MASSAQAKAFIKEIAPCAQKAYKELGKVLPSVCIAMACVECAYGTAGSVKHHSYLGHKVGKGTTALKYWGGKFFNAKTSEEYQVGVHTIIRDNFRAFDSMEQCVFNFYELLNTALYKRVLPDVDYATQMKQIKECGYMTSSPEVNTVISIIKKYELTKYDGEQKESLYYPVTSYKGNSIVTALKEMGIDSGYSFRKKLASKNGISNFSGTAEQNTSLLNLLKEGKLLKI